MFSSTTRRIALSLVATLLLTVAPQAQSVKGKAADLIPEVKAHAEAKANAVHFAAFAAGVALMLAVKLALEP